MADKPKTLNEINKSFSAMRTNTVENKSLAVELMFQFIKQFIKMFEIKDFGTFVFIRGDDTVSFDFNSDLEIKELLKRYIEKDYDNNYKVEVAIGLGEEHVSRFLSFGIKVELFTNNSNLSIPNLKENSYHSYSVEFHKTLLSNTENNEEKYSILIRSLIDEINSFLTPKNYDYFFAEKIVELRK